MSFGFGGYPMQAKTKYLFIDGSCLRYIIEDTSTDFFDSENIRFNFQHFARGFDKVFYFDALPARREKESIEDYERRIQDVQFLFDTIRMTDSFHVYLGTTQHRRGKSEQKKVDILLATHMFKHTFYKNMDAATLIAGDGDFVPLVDTLVDLGMHVTLWYGDTRNCKTSKELIGAADASRRISLRDIYSSSSTAIKQRYGLPNGILKSKDEPLAARIKIWTDSRFGEIEVFKNDAGDYWIIFESIGRNQYVHYKHTDIGYLRKFLKAEDGIEVPEL